MSAPTTEQRRTMRVLFSPRNPEMPQACASCPFRVGNDAEFGGVLARLAAALGKRFNKRTGVSRARLRVLMDVEHSGEFVCHGSAYDASMQPRPIEDRRQCAGATKYFKTGERVT